MEHNFLSLQRHLVNLCLMLLAGTSSQQDIDRLLKLRVPVVLIMKSKSGYQKIKNTVLTWREYVIRRKGLTETKRMLEKTTWRLFTASESDEDDIFITQKDRVDGEESSIEVHLIKNLPDHHPKLHVFHGTKVILQCMKKMS